MCAEQDTLQYRTSSAWRLAKHEGRRSVAQGRRILERCQRIQPALTVAEEYAALVGSDSFQDVVFNGARVVFDRADRPSLRYDRPQSCLFQ